MRRPGQQEPPEARPLWHWQWSTAVSVLVVVLGVVYLAAIPFGLVDERFGVAEALFLLVVLVFGTGQIQRVEELAFSGQGFNVKLREVSNRQAAQQQQIDDLRFLVAHFLSDEEVDHLRKLVGDEPFGYKDYRENSWLRQRRKPGARSMSLLPESGPDLREHLEITPEGRTFLAMRDRAALEDVTEPAPRP